MPRKRDPELVRLERLYSPPQEAFREARRKGVAETEAVLNDFVRLVEAEGEPHHLYHAWYEYARYYAYLMGVDQGTSELAGKLRAVIAKMETYEPNGPQLPIYAASIVYNCLHDTTLALRLTKKGLHLALTEEQNPREGWPPQYPFRAMALRVELSILSDTEPNGPRVLEILEELASLGNVGTGHDYNREKTIEKLLAANIRTESLKKVLLKDRKFFPHRRNAKYIPPAVPEIDNWLKLFDSHNTL